MYISQTDLCFNNMGFTGTEAILKAQRHRKALGMDPIDVELEGNLVFAEIMNSVTHGLGSILCVAGCIFLAVAVGHKTQRHIASCALYLFSLCLLFLSSTLYHSFFALKTTRSIFQVPSV